MLKSRRLERRCIAKKERATLAPGTEPAVFDVVAALGTGNARAMAAGIGRATLPTMAGLVVALPGLYFTAQLEHAGGRHLARLADRLRPRGAA